MQSEREDEISLAIAEIEEVCKRHKIEISTKLTSFNKDRFRINIKDIKNGKKYIIKK